MFGIKTLSTNSCNWGHAHFMMTGDNLHDERFCAICFYFVEQHQLFNLTFYYQCTRGRPGNGLMVFYLDKAAISIQCGFLISRSVATSHTSFLIDYLFSQWIQHTMDTLRDTDPNLYFYNSTTGRRIVITIHYYHWYILPP